MAFPPTHPFAVGENVTLMSMLCPAARVNGRLNWGKLNSVPRRRLIAETVTLVWPLLVKVMSWDSVCPTGTVPKYRTEGLKVNCRVVVCAPKEKAVAYKATIIANKTRLERG